MAEAKRRVVIDITNDGMLGKIVHRCLFMRITLSDDDKPILPEPLKLELLYDETYEHNSLVRKKAVFNCFKFEGGTYKNLNNLSGRMRMFISEKTNDEKEAISRVGNIFYFLMKQAQAYGINITTFTENKKNVLMLKNERNKNGYGSSSEL